MMSRIRSPLLQAMSRHRAIAGLLALQVAFAAAACANTFAMLTGDIAAMRLPSGMDEAGLVVLPMPTDGTLVRPEAMARLRALPGVRSVVAIGGTPFGIDISSHASRDATGLDGVAASQYETTQGAVAALGLDLVAGRDFLDDEFPVEGDADASPGTAIVSHALAQRLHGSDQAAVGRALYLDGEPLRIVGVVAHLLRGQPSVDAADGGNEYALLVPEAPDPHLGAYMLRVDPEDARHVASAAAAALSPSSGAAPDVPGTLADARADHFAKARADVALLLAATAAFLGVTAIGIFGLSFFWVRKRTAAIGIRRALGTNRGAVVRWLLLENAMVVIAGNTGGALCALAANRWLVAHSGMPPLPAAYLVAALAATWVVAAVAALLPALRAASVAPAMALRAP
jgi:putative ABC transport system permease protein